MRITILKNKTNFILKDKNNWREFLTLVALCFANKASQGRFSEIRPQCSWNSYCRQPPNPHPGRRCGANIRPTSWVSWTQICCFASSVIFWHRHLYGFSVIQKMCYCVEDGWVFACWTKVNSNFTVVALNYMDRINFNGWYESPANFKCVLVVFLSNFLFSSYGGYCWLGEKWHCFYSNTFCQFAIRLPWHVLHCQSKFRFLGRFR